MGVAGVALLYAFISFFKLIGAFSKWSSWKSKGVLCPAMVVDVIKKEENYKNKKGVTHYQYSVAVDYHGKEPMTIYPMAVFEETVYSNETSDVAVGKELKLLYNPKTSVCVDAAELKSAIKTQLTTLIVSIAIFIGCFVLVDLIG